MNRTFIVIVSVLVITVVVLASFALFQVAEVEKKGQGIGCFFTSEKGSDFPRTLVEWDVRPGDIAEVGMMIKLGESPLPANMSTSFGIFVKNSYPYPSPELPEDDLRLFGTASSAQWVSLVVIWGTNDTVTYETDTKSVTLDPQHWYQLKIVIEVERHSFFVDGNQVASIIVQPPKSAPPPTYGKGTAFGVTLGPYSHGCFGDYYVESHPTWTLATMKTAPNLESGRETKRILTSLTEGEVRPN